VLVTGPGLGFEDDDVHPAILTVAPVITTSIKMRCFFIFSFSLNCLQLLGCLVMHDSFNEVCPLNHRTDAAGT